MHSIQLTRTNSENTDFIELVRQLDAELAIRDGDDHAFYAQFNKTATLRYVIVAYQNNIAAGSGAMRELQPGIMEVKRMFTVFESRGKGIAQLVLNELEAWAKELGHEKCVLETGGKQPEAIALYTKSGYRRIPNYGNYVGVYNSLCFEKELTS